MAIVYGNQASLAVALAGNGQTTNVGDRYGPDNNVGINPALVRLVTVIGATPTCTYAIEGSADNANWWSLLYAVSATPATVVATTFVVTTATTKLLIVQPNQPYRFLRLTMSANTNVTNTIDAFFFRG
jgi:hypothetical protein